MLPSKGLYPLSPHERPLCGIRDLGSGRRSKLTSCDAFAIEANFSVDGQLIYFSLTFLRNVLICLRNKPELFERSKQ